MSLWFWSYQSHPYKCVGQSNFPIHQLSRWWVLFIKKVWYINIALVYMTFQFSVYKNICNKTLCCIKHCHTKQSFGEEGRALTLNFIMHIFVFQELCIVNFVFMNQTHEIFYSLVQIDPKSATTKLLKMWNFTTDRWNNKLERDSKLVSTI